MPTEFEISKYQWFTAMQAVEMSDVEIARMMYWCKSPKDEVEPDLVTMIALWTEADEKSQLLEDESVQISDSSLPDVSQIKEQLATQEGFMIASEEYQSKLYQQLLNKQLRERIQSFLNLISLASTEVLRNEEIEDILSERDTLEYARMGIHVIQMQGRLSRVEYSGFAQYLKQTDIQLRQFLKSYTGFSKPPYVPSTFWWRK